MRMEGGSVDREGWAEGDVRMEVMGGRLGWWRWGEPQRAAAHSTGGRMEAMAVGLGSRRDGEEGIRR